MHRLIATNPITVMTGQNVGHTKFAKQSLENRFGYQMKSKKHIIELTEIN